MIGPHFKRVIFVTLLSMLLSAVIIANFIIIGQFASQNGNHWIGPLSTSLIYLGIGFGCLYSAYLSKMAYRTTIFIGATSRIAFIGFTALFLFAGFQSWVLAIIIIGSVLCGLVASMYYNGICNYVNECGQRDDQTKLYFGIYIGVLKSSSLIGNLISASLIQPLGQQMYSVLILVVGFGISCCFLFIRQFRNKEECDINDNSIVYSLNSNDTKDTNSQIGQQNQQTHTAPLIICFCHLFAGAIQSYLYSQLSIQFSNYFNQRPKEEVNQLTFIAMAIQGAGQLVACLLFSYFCKRIQSITTLFFYNGLFFILSVAVLFYAFTYQCIWLIFVTLFFTGMTDCLAFSMAASIGGRWGESGISHYNFGSSIGVTLLTALNIFVDLPYLMIIYLLLQMLSTRSLWKHRHFIDGQKATK